MLQFIYDLLIHLYALAIQLFGTLNRKARLRAKDNLNFKDIAQKRKINKKLIWLHCASLGEFEQGRPVIERFHRLYPDWQILVTFFSPSGYEVRKNYDLTDLVCYLPIDKKTDVKAFLDTFQPTIAIFVKYEFWRNCILELRKRNVPLLSISSIFRESQAFFKPWAGFQREPLQGVNHFFVQNEESVQLLNRIGIDAVTLAGDTRFDRVADTLKNIKAIPLAEKFKVNAEVMVCGSVWSQDMDVLIPFINQAEKLKFIIAPHEIHEHEIEKWKARLNKKCINYSESAENTDLKEFQVLFIDNVGILSSLYQYGNYAYIGGAFGAGLHNILEAATFGLPLFFGNKKYAKFQEAKDLIALKVAFPISDFENLNSHFQLVDSEQKAQIAATSKSYIHSNTGATDLVLTWLKDYMATL